MDSDNSNTQEFKSSSNDTTKQTSIASETAQKQRMHYQFQDALAEDNYEYGQLKSWGYNNTLEFLEGIEDEQVRRVLVNESYVVGRRQWFPLYEAQDKNNVELVRLLLEAGADPLKRYEPRIFEGACGTYSTGAETDALTTAIYFNRLEIVQAIVESVNDVSTLGRHLSFAKSQLASGWYSHNPRGKKDMISIVELLSPPIEAVRAKSEAHSN